MNRTFSIRIVYFKPSGTFYTESTFTVEDVGISITCDMTAVARSIRQCRKLKDLPGLAGGWEGPILIDCDDGYPVLILGE